MQEIDHGPQVASFFHVDLKNISQVVEGRAGQAQCLLLFDRGRFGISLRDNNAAQDRTILTGYVLPCGLTLVATKIDLARFITRLQEDAPAILRHSNVTELRPAVGCYAGGGAQIDFIIAGFIGAHVRPPAEESGLPVFQGALQNAVASEVDVVRNFLGVIGHRKSTSLGSRAGQSISNSFPVEFYRRAGAIDFQRTVRAYSIGANEDPILPSGKAAEYARFQCFDATKAQVGFKTCQSVGRERCARLD